MTTAATLIGRKIEAARPCGDPTVMTPERALHTAFARAAEKQMNLPLRMPALGEIRLSGPEIAEILPEHALLLLLHGPQEGIGLAVFAPAALSALIEMMTLGRVADHPPAARRPTRTDAAMICGFLDQVMGECESLLAGEADLIWAGGFRYGGHLSDPRPVGLMLEEPFYRVFRMSLAFGVPSGPDAEVRTGDVLLALPAAGRGQPPTVRPDPDAVYTPSLIETGWPAALERAVLPAGAEVQAVLARVSLPLVELLKIEAGQSLPLPQGALAAVQLEGVDGRLICLGQLGQGNGRRALRLTPGEASEQPVGLPVMPSALLPACEQPLQVARRGVMQPDPLAPVAVPKGGDPADPLADGPAERDANRHARAG